MGNKALKGINLGGWLLMEGYILRGRNIAEHQIKRQFKKNHRAKALFEFEKAFRNNFISRRDFERIWKLGAKIIRLPFSYRLIEEKAFHYRKDGFYFLDKAFQWAEEYNLKIILDLHAACGAQNFDWHSDSNGKAMLWEKESYRKRTYKLWEIIADRYKNHSALYAYDVLNEPILGNKSLTILKKFYKKIIKTIRNIDKKTLIYLEGSIWAQKIEFLDSLLEDNVGVSIHSYQPLDYVFTFNPALKYPGKTQNVLWNKKRLYNNLKTSHKFSVKNKVKLLVGEFGINWRGGYFGECTWLDDILSIFDDFGFDYTYWTYKSIANDVFPSGVYQYVGNNKFVRREGPIYGWENYSDGWKKEKNKIISVWKTENYVFNKNIGGILKKHFLKK